MKTIKIFFIFFTSIALSQNTVSTVKKTKEDSIYSKITEGVLLAIMDYKFNEGIQLTTKYTELAKSIKNDSLIGKGYYALGIINAELGNITKAVDLLKKAEKTLIKTENYRPLGYTYSNMANLYYEIKKDTLSSLLYSKKAIQSFKKATNDRGIEIVYYNLGHLYEETNQLKKAIPVLDSAIYHAKKRKDDYLLSYSYLSLSKIYYKKEEVLKSIKYINRSLKIAKEKDFKDVLVKLYKLKYLIFKRKRELDKALFYLEKLTALSETIFEKEIGIEERESAAIFETKEKQKLLDKINSENKLTVSKIKTTTFFNSLIGLSLLTSLILVLLIYKNNTLKKTKNILLEAKNNELKNLQIQTELNFLKNQIQPHFFFNTLNNLYALLIINSEKANEVIKKLSELMKYALYGANNYKTPVINEIKNIKNYIKLECIRYEKKTFPKVKIEGELGNIYMPPLLFITLVENCFKHGNVSEESFYADILFKNVNSTHLLFTISNSFDETKKKKEKKQSGIGLENNKRRLQLIYKSNFSLKTSVKKNIYTTTLILPV